MVSLNGHELETTDTAKGIPKVPNNFWFYNKK
jgi:hypothetical protein